jgi:hypothetical protein
MKTFGYLLIFFVSLNSVFSQDSLQLHTVAFRTNLNIHIEQVYDEREKKSLGEIESLAGEKTQLYLTGGAEQAIQGFMNVSLPKSDTSTPVFINIKSLEIQQAQTGVEELTARVYVRLIFFIKRTNQEIQLLEIGHYEDQLFSFSNTLHLHETHEQRIRAALEYCVISLMNEPSIPNTLQELNSGKRAPPLVNHKITLLEQKPSLTKWFNLLTFKKSYSQYYEGWEVSYTGFADSDKDFIIPFEFSYGQSKTKSGLVKKEGYSSIDTYVFGAGANGYVKLASGVYLDLGVSVPIGAEILKDLNNKQSENFIIGIGASQGVKIIPWKDFGLVFGASVFEQVQSSKVFKKDFGVEFEIGVNF